MYGDEKIFEAFVQQDGCMLCGSQRCDGSFEWAQGCRRYRDFVATYENAETDKPKAEDTVSV